MKIAINSFKIQERYVLHDPSFWRWITGRSRPDQYHFDCVIKINREDTIKLRNLEERKDLIQLPNNVRLMVWHVEPGIIRAKTYKFIDQDLRKYKPTELYLVYPHRHGHVTLN